MRSPPCLQCGLVGPWIDLVPNYRHCCNPTSVQAMQLGVDAVERIGRSISAAFAALAPPPSTPTR